MQSKVQELLALADVQIDGQRPWDIQVHNKNFYDRVLAQGNLWLGESYMDGRWECKALDQLIYKLLSAELEQKIKPDFAMLVHLLKAKFCNLQSKKRAAQDVWHHYDIGNELYSRMLDQRMVYTCAYRKEADNLNEAQEAKLDLVCKKIGLKSWQKVLDIGCGRGSFAKFAAEKYGAHVVGITISREQAELAKKLCKGLPVEIRLQDYRELNEKFDHIISLGMFEHVGYKNYREYMEVVHRCLKEDGLFLLHTIGGNSSVKNTDPWIHKYIFPNGVIPSISQISKAVEGIFVVEDRHNFGPYYDKTLMARHHNFLTHRDEIKHLYNKRFQRMRTYYLLSCAGSFRARKNQLRQIVLSPHGVAGGYTTVR